MTEICLKKTVLKKRTIFFDLKVLSNFNFQLGCKVQTQRNKNDCVNAELVTHKGKQIYAQKCILEQFVVCNLS
jgi:hypothetical protein